MYQALSHSSVPQATKSWAGHGNKANDGLQFARGFPSGVMEDLEEVPDL